MKILIISSIENNLNHSSGEVDSLIMRLGFCLRGHEVFVSEDENYDESGEWDHILYFGNNFSNLLRINQVCLNAKLTIFPFFNLHDRDHDEFLLKKYKELELKWPNVTIIIREHSKLNLLSKYDIKSHLLKYSWFLPPMAIRDSCTHNKSIDKNYICIFTDQFEADAIMKFINSDEREGRDICLYTKNVELKNSLANEKLRCFTKTNYGSSAWYQAITNSIGLFEPSNRVTASALEFLYSSKNIYVKNPEEFLMAIPEINCSKSLNYHILNICDKNYLSKYLAYNFVK